MQETIRNLLASGRRVRLIEIAFAIRTDEPGQFCEMFTCLEALERQGEAIRIINNRLGDICYRLRRRTTWA